MSQEGIGGTRMVAGTLIHGGCGGRLEPITTEPVPAGDQKPKILYHLLECQECHKIISWGEYDKFSE